MKKDIKDYLHLYLGCQVLVDGDTSGTLVGIRNTYDVELYVNNQWLHHRFCKLILRSLNDITEEERAERWQIIIQGNEKGNRYEVIRWELSKSFDLFGLIEAGLAIDKTTIRDVN